MNALKPVAFLLLIIGGVNWGLIGLGDFLLTDLDVVNMLLGAWPKVESLVYVLVGLSAVYVFVNNRRSMM